MRNLQNTTHSGNLYQSQDYRELVTYPEITCAREVFTILVKRYRHHPVSSIERLLHSITMVDINVYVQHSLVISKYIIKGKSLISELLLLARMDS